MIDAEMAGACFANRLRSAARAITRHYDAALKPLDLRVSQLSIIELAGGLGMDRSTLSRNFDPLERRALVALSPEARHRARKVELTEAGAALLQQAYPIWQAAQAEMVAAVPDIQQTTHRLDPLIAHFS